MNDIFAKWDNEIDVEGLKKEIDDIQNSNVDFEQAEHGTYEIKIGAMQVKSSKSGKPMLSVWFKVVEPGFTHLSFNMNQVLLHKYSIKNAMDFLRSLKSNQDIEFINYSQFAKLVEDVFNDINGKLEYVVVYGQNNAGFDTFEVTDVFHV